MADLQFVKGVQELLAKLRAKAAAAASGTKGSVKVSFRAPYAFWVHEHLTAHHVVGQAKFLEQPARQLRSDGTFDKLIRAELGRGRTVMQALLVCGLKLQREAQLLTPVATGLLKNSATTTLEL